ncbi:MAG: HupE/UreJ family protein [Aquabacterium sp.]|nr:HupE/UreJ family protein [Aquabacterium sp.]
MTRWTMHWRHVALALLWTCLALGTGQAHAHKPSDSYMILTARDSGLLDVSWHVALRDLDGELSLDANDDGRLTWGEVRTRWADMLRYVRSHLDLSRVAGGCELVAHSDEPPAVIEHSDGQYAVFNWSVQCPVSAGQTWADLDVAYHLFALTDPTHRGIVRWRVQGVGMGSAREVSSVVLGVSRPQHHLSWTGLQPAQALPTGQPQGASMPELAPKADLAGQPSVAGFEAQAAQTETHAALLLRYVREGVTHIAEGTDHILFLVSLLLVSVWRRDPARSGAGSTSGWRPRERWRNALGEVLRLVTAFTLAHSITLALAAFGVVSPPSRWVESLIALSVLLAALDNLWPLLHAPRWVVVFAFGLVHGFGFAGAMQDLGLSRENLAWPLLGFNLGVELGQLMLVAVVLPLAFSLRRTALYRQAVVRPGSVAIAALALLWLYQRAADVSLGWVPG